MRLVPHLSEMDIVTGVSTAKVAALVEILRDETDERLPRAARFALTQLADQIELLADQIGGLERARRRCRPASQSARSGPFPSVIVVSVEVPGVATRTFSKTGDDRQRYAGSSAPAASTTFRDVTTHRRVRPSLTVLRRARRNVRGVPPQGRNAGSCQILFRHVLRC